MLRQIASQFGAQPRLIGEELLAIIGRQEDGVRIRNVDLLDGDDLVVIHLLGQLAGQLDGLDVGAERTANAAFEDPLQSTLDASQKTH